MRSMEKKQHSAKFLKKRKLMMMLPLLVLPFLTMAFWALGGGTSSAENAKEQRAGLNLQLPDAQLKDESGFDKLRFYEQAADDSAKLKEALKNDPYYRNDLEAVATSYNPLNTSTYDKSSVDENTRRVYSKLDELNQQLNQPAQQTVPSRKSVYSSEDVDRLGEMMQVMNSPSEKDPEMEQINSMLDKIMDVQHPARVKERLKEKSLKHKSHVYRVNGNAGLGETIMVKDSVPRKFENKFYSEINKPLSDLDQSPNVTAVIHETQTLVAGSTVKLRLTSDVYIKGILIPSATFVFGTATLQNERLLITISSINYRNNLLPVLLSVHDIDGVAGVYIPGSINRDVAKQSADQSLSSVELVSMDPSLQAQAAVAGIGAAKTLLSKKVKLVKVTVKAGYKVLLKDENQQNN